MSKSEIFGEIDEDGKVVFMKEGKYPIPSNSETIVFEHDLVINFSDVNVRASFFKAVQEVIVAHGREEDFYHDDVATYTCDSPIVYDSVENKVIFSGEFGDGRRSYGCYMNSPDVRESLYELYKDVWITNFEDDIE